MHINLERYSKVGISLRVKIRARAVTKITFLVTVPRCYSSVGLQQIHTEKLGYRRQFCYKRRCYFWSERSVGGNVGEIDTMPHHWLYPLCPYSGQTNQVGLYFVKLFFVTVSADKLSQISIILKWILFFAWRQYILVSRQLFVYHRINSCCLSYIQPNDTLSIIFLNNSSLAIIS